MFYHAQLCLLVIVLMSVNAQDERQCPCNSQDLCEPLSQDKLNSNVGKSVIFTNAQNSSTVGDNWQWNKIGKWAPFTHLGPNYPKSQELYCKAHEENVPVLTWGYESWDGGSCPITRFYSWALSGSDNVYNKTAVDEWAVEAGMLYTINRFDDKKMLNL